jgi:hypothetical protein
MLFVLLSVIVFSSYKLEISEVLFIIKDKFEGHYMRPENALELLQTNASPLEDLCPGLTFQWLFNRQAFGMYAEHSSHKLVDIWADKILEVTRTWPKDRTIFVLNDFSGKDCAVTTYNQQKNRELLRKSMGHKVVNALVVKQNLTMQLTRLFIRALPKDKPIYLTFTREDALSWLKKQIDLDQAATSAK